MDVFQIIRGLSCVKKVCHLFAQHPQPFTCLFFLCPALNSKGIRVNEFETGVTARYKETLSESTQRRLELVRRFQEELASTGISFELKAICATADSLFLFSPPAGPPPVPSVEFPMVSNHQAAYERLNVWHELYCRKPWEGLPQRFVKQGEARLRGLLPDRCPKFVCNDFVRRTFAGFALDGIMIRDGCFGPRPVILGVESPEVAVLQNAALPQEERLPVIQLV
jgi:hypothetical protein